MKKPTVYLRTLLFSVALLGAQEVKLHVHSFDHDQQHRHIAAEDVATHSHLSEFHLSADISHIEHHGESVPEFDASPDCFLKKISCNVFTLALLVTLITFLLAGLYQQTFLRYRARDTIIFWRYLLSPPLRAPPL